LYKKQLRKIVSLVFCDLNLLFYASSANDIQNAYARNPVYI